MFRGLISGLIMGAIICGLVLATLSLVVGPPGPSAEAPSSVDVAIPAGSEFNQNRPEAPPVIPGSEETGGVGGAPLVAEAEGEMTPVADTAPASVPVSGSNAPDEMAAPATDDNNLVFSLGDDQAEEQNTSESPNISGPTNSGEAVPDTPDLPEMNVEPAQDQSDTDDGVIILELSDGSSEDEAQPTVQPVEVESPEVDEQDASQDEAPVLKLDLGNNTGEEATDEGGDSLFSSQSGSDAPETSVETPVIRLPSIRAEEDEVVPEIKLELGDEDASGAPLIQLGALARNSRPFIAVDDKPLMAIVLVDIGEEGLGQEGLSTFSFPVTIALDPTRTDPASSAPAYRAAGLEVLVQAPQMASDVTPEDVASQIASLVSAVPQAIGIVDAAQAGFGSNRRLIGHAINVLNEGGHGLLTYDRGLNTALQMAEKEGLPAGTIFRTIDADQEDAETIKRYLDRAAFRAGQEGHVIMIGHSYSETVTAIFTWVQENRAESVTLAPVSAILRK